MKYIKDFISLVIDELKSMLLLSCVLTTGFFASNSFEQTKYGVHFFSDSDLFLERWHIASQGIHSFKYIIISAFIWFIISVCYLRLRSKRNFADWYFYVDSRITQRTVAILFGYLALATSLIIDIILWLLINPSHEDFKLEVFKGIFFILGEFGWLFIISVCLLKYFIQIAKILNESNYPNHPRQSANA
ncbi:hypothetical protein [Snodgrassella communis]|uniref:hypothetical protein n=1 Tax=Snodgrassella communis TaxID=2946699 RepID=UPI000C1F90E7|nr:hypothetical protein [Snodgrassella communis]PIT19912.1 hypothetical protein BGI35_09495 [Snodgrassella communis]